MSDALQAPFPWFGGKSRVAPLVWERFGDVPNYVEPFFGSGAVLLGRPTEPKIETVNDLDGYVANFWRAVQHDPETVAYWADNPVNENDLHAREAWLLQFREELPARLEGDPDYYDAKIAGWWCWGICCWIGGGWCSGQGPWHIKDGKLVCTSEPRAGTRRKRVHLGDSGMGVNRRLVHLGDEGMGTRRRLVHLSDSGMGVNRQLVHAGRGLDEWMERLAARLRFVRVCCGDWSRVCGPSPTTKLGLTGMFLDPPYGAEAQRDDALYSQDSLSVAAQVREWAIAHGDDPKMRIALCGYEGEHDMPDSWQVVDWKAKGGYGNQGNGRGRANAYRERIWFSLHCLQPDRAEPARLLFEEVG